MKYLLLCLPTLLSIYCLIIAPTAMATDPTAWVINASGETLSRINLTSKVVSNDTLPLGSDVFSYPNQIVVRDTMAFVVCSGTDEIQVIDLNSVSTVRFIGTGAESNPYWITFLNSQTAYVTSFVNNSLIKLDMTTNSVVKETVVGVSPEGVIIHNFKAYIGVTAFDLGTYLYGQGKVAVYDTQTDEKLYDINVGVNPQYLAVDKLGRVHVVCTGDYWSSFGIVYIIDPTLDAVVDSITIGGSPGQIAISPNGVAYLAAGGWDVDGFVYTYHSTTGQLLHGSADPLVVDYGCWMVVPYQDSSVFVGGMSNFVTPIDSAGAILNSFTMGNGPVHLDFNYQPGDLNGDFAVDISDLVYLVDYMFTSGAEPIYPKWRANISGDYSYDISDLVYLVDYMFIGGLPPTVGPTWLK